MRYLNDFIVVVAIVIMIMIIIIITNVIIVIVFTIIIIIIIIIFIIVIVIIRDALSEVYLKHYHSNGQQFLSAEYAHWHADQCPLPLGFAASFIIYIRPLSCYKPIFHRVKYKEDRIQFGRFIT